MNKSKKIMAGVGIGLALCAGTGMLTGCSDMNLTDSQQEKLASVIDNSGKLMEDYENDMKDIKDRLSEQSKQLMFDNAYKAWKLGESNFYFNKNNMFDNTKIKMQFLTEGESDITAKHQLVTLDNGKLALLSNRSTWGDNYQLSYECTKVENESTTNIVRTYKSCDLTNDAPVENSQASIEDRQSMSIWSSRPELFATIGLITQYDIQAEDVVAVDIMSNGNYKLKALKLASGLYLHIVVEVTQDGTLISTDFTGFNYTDVSGQLEKSGKTVEFKSTYEYGASNKTDIVAKVAIAEELANRA